MNKIIIASLFSLIIFFSGKAQTSSIIRTMDVSIIKNLLHNNNGDTINEFFILAKIDSIQLASKVYFLLGSANDQSNALNVIGTVQNIGGQYSIGYNGQNYPFQNYTVSIPVTVLKPNLNNLRVVTFYVEDNLGRFTIKKYLQLN